LIFLIEIAAFIAVILGLIVLVQGVRKVPVNYAKQIVGNRQFGGARQFLPLKVNAAGVMPIIFAQAIMFLPTIFAGFQTGGKSWAVYFTSPTNGVYMIIYGIMTIGFTFVYTSLIFNPKQMSDDLKRNNGFIPGVKPGQPTTEYIGTIMDRITLPGAVLLAIVGILPGIMEIFGVTQGFATFYGGTSLLIMVAVVLDTLQQIETQLLMRQYDGLMSSGRIQGRTAAPGVTGGI
jgi:preprotein translocase subunit SecY